MHNKLISYWHKCIGIESWEHGGSLVDYGPSAFPDVWVRMMSEMCSISYDLSLHTIIHCDVLNCICFDVAHILPKNGFVI